MALLNEEFENTTVVLGVADKSNIRWIATGFFVIFPLPDGSHKKLIYLVTNKHVLVNKDLIYIRAYLKDGSIKNIPAPLVNNSKPLFCLHKNPTIDIAVLQVNGSLINTALDKIKAFEIGDNTYTSQEYLENGGFDGSPIFMLGFPMGIIDDYSTSPICRKGCIARFKLNDIRNRHNFLLDIQNFPGNSGSPIISCPEIVGLGNTKVINEARLIGIVHSYLPYKDYLRSEQTNEVVEVRTENSGIAVAHPTEYIREIIEEDLKTKGLLR